MSLQRYFWVGPTDEDLASHVPVAASVSVSGPRQIVDVDLSNDAFKADLDDIMFALGYVFDSTTPPATFGFANRDQTPVVVTAVAIVLPTVGNFVFDTTGGVITQAIPAASTSGGPLHIKNGGPNALTLTPSGGDTIDGLTTITLASRQAVTLRSDGVSAWFLYCFENPRLEQYIASDGLSSTAPIAYVTKVTLTTPASNPAGDYYVHWGCELSQSVVAVVSFVRLIQDGATVLNESAEDLITEFAAHSNLVQVALAAGSHTFEIQFRSSLVTGLALIRRARIWVELVRRST